MSSSLVLSNEQDEFTGKQLAALNALGVQDATPGDLALFLNQAQRTGLDPFSKQIYMIGRRQKDQQGNWVTKQTIQVGIDGFRLIARRAADMKHERFSMEDTLWADPNGKWHDMWIWNTPPRAAKVVVIRGDDERFSAVASYDEYVGLRFDKKTGTHVPNSMWAGKPALMLAKCAEALALRRAFPQELSGLYTPDEMQNADVETPVNMPPTQPESSERPQPRSDSRSETPVRAEVMASQDQCERITKLMKQGGVESLEQAVRVFKALTGRDIQYSSQLTAEEAGMLLSGPELVVSRTRDTLAQNGVERDDGRQTKEGKES